MIGPRYECREDATSGAWCVYDTRRDRILLANDRAFTGLRRQDAAEFAELMNSTGLDVEYTTRKRGRGDCRPRGITFRNGL